MKRTWKVLEQAEEPEFKGRFHQNEPATLISGAEEAALTWRRRTAPGMQAGVSTTGGCV